LDELGTMKLITVQTEGKAYEVRYSNGKKFADMEIEHFSPNTMTNKYV
jgi:hypothetical protein